MRKLLIIILLLVSCLRVAAQGGLDYSVRGKVVDAGSGRPVAAVSVAVQGKGFSTVTNVDGSCVIKSSSPIRELVFSHIGYRETRRKADGGELMVMLPPVAYPLPEASLVSGDPREILGEAIKAIADNYPSEPELLHCFYRETLQKRQRYIAVNEAVARIYKMPYKHRSVRADKTALEKSRIIISQRKRDTLSVRIMGGPTLAANFDPVKNPDIIFNDVDLPLYNFEMEAPAYIGDRLQFVISFYPALDAEYPLYRGMAYIDRETLAFSRVELSMDVSDKAKATRVILVRKPMGLRFTPKEMTITVTYRQEGGVMRMDYFRSSLSFNCDWRKHLFATSYVAVNELVVTDLVKPAVPIGRDEVFRPTDVLDDKAPLFLDPDFWKDYNIIEPSESLEHAVSRLRK